MPLPVLVVDADVRILEYNPAARCLIGEGGEVILRRKSGDTLHCLHAVKSSGGCGTSHFCKDCVIRQSVAAAFEGSQVSRKRTTLEQVADGQTRQVEMLVSSALFEYDGQPKALLILEDISELAALRSLLPICARCKKIRDDQRYWHQLEEYCHKNLSLDFTHSICPECAKELYSNA